MYLKVFCKLCSETFEEEKLKKFCFYFARNEVYLLVKSVQECKNCKRKRKALLQLELVVLVALESGELRFQ
ncbi:hypothetical protein AHAS_Ahas13G0411200 [Arachis hypogaea]